jgi:hypothetical protein
MAQIQGPGTRRHKPNQRTWLSKLTLRHLREYLLKYHKYLLSSQLRGSQNRKIVHEPTADNSSILLLSALHMNFYREAARILDEVDSKKCGSLKSIVFDARTKSSSTNQKRLYALLSETLKGIFRGISSLIVRKRRFTECYRFIAITKD